MALARFDGCFFAWLENRAKRAGLKKQVQLCKLDSGKDRDTISSGAALWERELPADANAQNLHRHGQYPFATCAYPAREMELVQSNK